MMESYLSAQQPAGVRMWQTRRAFYPAHVALSRAQEERQKCLEKLTKNGRGSSAIAFGPLEVHVVFPYMWPPDFDQYMIERGPKEWKTAIDTWPANTAKALILMILSRPRLEMYLEAMVAMYGEERQLLGARMFEVGLARCMRQMLLEPTNEVAYYKLMNPGSAGKLLGIVPLLKDEEQMTMLAKPNKRLEMCMKFAKREAEYKLTGKSPEEVFLARLYCAYVTAKADRWAECWAHSLSTLDHASEINEETRKRYMHDLFCFLAHSAGRCFIRSAIVFRALEQAHGHMHNLEHPWKRLLVFQDLLVHWGFFELEEIVFEKGMEIIPLKTDYHTQLVRQHLKALMHRVENILLYQYTRQKFHAACDLRVCKKPHHLAYSFVKAEDLTETIDFYSRTLKEPGEREYYSAYVHMYTGLRFSPKTLRDGLDHLQQAKYYFDRCVALMRTRYEAQKDATIMARYLSKNRCNTLDKFTETFNNATLMTNNSGSAEALFRIVLMSTYFGTQFYTLQAAHVQSRTADYYKRATQERGYRQNLLDQCQNEDRCHKDLGDEVSDYPRIDLCMEKEQLDDVAARCYWRKEMDGKLLPFTECEVEGGKETRTEKKKKTPQRRGRQILKECRVLLERMETPGEPKKKSPLQPESIAIARRRKKVQVATMSTSVRRRKQTLTPKMLDFYCNDELYNEEAEIDTDEDYNPSQKRTKKMAAESGANSSAARRKVVKKLGRPKKEEKKDDDKENRAPDLLPGDLPNSCHFLVFGGDTLNFEVYCFGRRISKELILPTYT